MFKIEQLKDLHTQYLGLLATAVAAGPDSDRAQAIQARVDEISDQIREAIRDAS